jgi:hypothetical protein
LTLSEIVLDFLKDINEVEWFLGCKGFKVVQKHEVIKDVSLRFKKSMLQNLFGFGGKAKN